jgi:hypothetical protein
MRDWVPDAIDAQGRCPQVGRLNEEPSEEGLRRLAKTEGIDAATATLYGYLRNASRHQEFINAVETGGAPPALRGKSPRVLVMPGAFHAEYPQTGGDGGRVLELAAELGWPAERVDVPSLAPMARNAAALVEALRRAQERPAVVVSLSKGGADVRAAIERADAAEELRDVRAWVSLSGMTMGTPLVAWLRARPLRCWGVRALLRLRRQRFAVLEELRRGAALAAPFTLPPKMRAIHVLGFPRVRDLSDEWARRGHARLADLGPNDGGGVMLADALRLPGDVYPVWGADHYLRRADARDMLRRVLREAGREP